MIASQYYRRQNCRLCGSNDLTLVITLTPTPPANAFVGETALGENQEHFPLDVFFCEVCTHVQLLDVVDPEMLFTDYIYVSGTSPVFVKHFEDYAATIIRRFAPSSENDLVVDIGSNDGTLLSKFQEYNFRVLGLDPAEKIAAKATADGIQTLPAFFTSDLARSIVLDHGHAKIVTANNVFAHADDLADIVKGVRKILAPSGVFVFEVSYLIDVYEKILFDTIYHEHLAYHSVKPLVAFFESHGMELIAAERVSSHGGSLRGVAQISGGPRMREDSVQARIDEEKRLGLDRSATLKSFGGQIQSVKDQLTALLGNLKSAGDAISGFGAPAKATTLMHHFGIGPDLIDYIVDDSPHKQGLYSPGLHIPILPPDAIYSDSPDAVVILAWNFANPIMRNHQRYIEQGGRFIVPLPKVTVF